MLPNAPGVYLVLREPATQPSFLSVSSGGNFKGKDPTESLTRLPSEWVESAWVLYIGMTTTTLKKRVGAYLRFGKGAAVGHWGGRFVWQLADAEKLQICWKVTSADNAVALERDLLNNFGAQNEGRLPFANLRA